MPVQSLRTKLITFWVTSAALLVVTTNLTAFRTALDAQFKQLQQTLTAIATTGALSIDGDLHRKIPSKPSSLELPEYKTLVKQLRSIRDANPSIRYVYTMTPSETPGQWYYIGDAEEQDTSLPGEPYDVSRYPAMAQGVKEPSVDPEMTFDEWGALLSGYAPIRNSEGQVVGVLGIDMSGAQVVRTQAALHRWQIAVIFLGLVTIIALGFLVAQWISQPIQNLVRGTQRLGQGDLDYRVPVQSRDEVGALAQAFNNMASLLQASLKQLQEHAVSAIQSLSTALEAKDSYTRGHSARVQHYAVKIAKQMDLPEEQVELIEQVAALHDIGKIGVREEVLNKASALTTDEYDHVKRHPDIGYKILAPLKLPKEALEIVRYHHERLDGKGYPVGLRKGELPTLVGVVTVADCFDAMTSHRPYRPKPLSYPEAVTELRRCSDSQFFPEVVEALVQVLRQEGRVGPNGSGDGSHSSDEVEESEHYPDSHA